MATYAKRLETVERAAARLPGSADDPFRDYSSADWAGAFSEILGRPVPVVGSARGLRAAQAAMLALPVPDLKGVLAWLKDSPHERQEAKGKD